MTAIPTYPETLTAEAETAAVSPSYRILVDHYERCLAQHGDTPQGVDWPNAADAEKRYAVMLDVIRPHARIARSTLSADQSTDRVTLLDLGCGAGHLFEYLRKTENHTLDYLGLDLSDQFVAHCRAKFPEVPFYQRDILHEDLSDLPPIDYAILNGVFTEKRELSFDTMWEFTQSFLKKAFSLVRHGIAFNVMSKQVDWERADLFHLPLDLLAGFLTKQLSRHFIIRNDYGLYEYTTYLYKEPTWPR